MNSNDTYQRSGWWWRTMGFTRTHLLGVFITESALALIGIGLVVAAVTKAWADTMTCLLVAVCVFLLQLSVLLSSILSLLFYMGSRVERATDQKGESVDHAA